MGKSLHGNLITVTLPVVRAVASRLSARCAIRQAGDQPAPDDGHACEQSVTKQWSSCVINLLYLWNNAELERRLTKFSSSASSSLCLLAARAGNVFAIRHVKDTRHDCYLGA